MFALVVIIAWCATVMSRADGHRRRPEEEMKVARDQAVEASLSKSSFVANMSHEIRTPLNGVIGMTELLLQTPLNDEQREYGQAVRSSGRCPDGGHRRHPGLLEDRSGQARARPVRLPARRARRYRLLRGGRAGAGQGVALRTALDEDLPHEVRGDAVRVRQVLLNLMSNALKFTTEGEVVVKVSSRGGADQARHICFAVSDTGIGIVPASLDTVFESFAQAESTTARKYGGTGLGLAISKQLVELMHGEIGATSVVGAGSRFWFTVPLASASEAVAPPGGPAAAVPDFVLATGTRGTLLVAEDNEINQLVVRRMLEKLGYDSDLAATGAKRSTSTPGRGTRRSSWTARCPSSTATTRRERSARSKTRVTGRRSSP
jgi:signal transduction histidine kinase